MIHALRTILRRHGAELILHGHNHRLMTHYIEGPDRPVPVVGVASASAIRGTPSHRHALATPLAMVRQPCCPQ